MSFNLGVRSVTGLDMTLGKSVSYHSINRRFGSDNPTELFSLKLQSRSYSLMLPADY